MKQVAQMLGVELDEEFCIPYTGLIYKFVDNGLLQKHIPIMTWHYDNNALRCLLSGEYTVTKFKGWSGENIKTIEIKYELKDVENKFNERKDEK